MPVVFVLLAAVLWGTTGTAASFLPHTVSPLATGAVTMGVGGVLLLAVFARRSLPLFGDRRVVGWLVLGALGVTVYPLAFYTSMAMAGVALGTVVTLGSAPVFAALIESVIDHRPLTRGWMTGTALAIVGVTLLALGTARGPGERSGGSMAVAVLLALLAGLAYAFYTYASHRAMQRGAGSLATMGAMCGLGGVLLLPVLLVLGRPLLQSAQTIGIAAYLSIGPMFLAYVLFAIGLISVRASSATTLTLVEPAVASVLAVAVVGEHVALAGWLGIVLIAAGVVVVGLLGERPRAVRPEHPVPAAPAP